MPTCCNIEDIDIRTQQAVRLCLANNWPFALYCLPGESQLHFMADPDKNLSSGNETTFFAVPFNHKYADLIVIRNIFDAEQILNYSGTKGKAFSAKSEPEANRDEYIKAIGLLIRELRQNKGKCVISRVFPNRLTSSWLSETLLVLFSENPGAFRSLFFHPACGSWLVMSPELLADYDTDGRTFRTMSLAGTRPAGTCAPWDKKNIAEQQIVTDSIVSGLKSLGLNPEVSQCRTLSSNLVEHLCTDVTVNIKGEVTIEKILDTLSPTPAIAGFPKDISLRQIDTYESHKRMMYGGYFGICDSNHLLAHVTLRCALIDDKICHVFVGSGITPDSDPSCEWDEIMLKAKQFFACFNKTSFS